MGFDCWDMRSTALQKLGHVQNHPEHGKGNLAIRIQQCDVDYVIAVMLDLQLDPNISRPSHKRRCPRATDYIMIVPASECPHLELGQDFMLVGAVVEKMKTGLPTVVHWPMSTETTGAIRLNRKTSAICSMVEWFAGGMGAWSLGCDELPVEVVAHVDNKLFAIQSLLVDQMMNEKTTFEQASERTYHLDVANMKHLVALGDEEGIMASPPCQPFSALGCMRGLDDRSAGAWDAMLQALRFAQRRFLVLENVPGLLRHRDFPKILEAMRWAGFVLVSHQVLEASGIGCAARPRLIMLFWNDADWDSMKPPQVCMPSSVLPKKPLSCAESGSVWKNLPTNILQELILCADEQRLLSDRNSLPVWQRHTQLPVW